MKYYKIINIIYILLILMLFLYFRFNSSENIYEYPDYLMNLGIYVYGVALSLNMILEKRKIRNIYFSIFFLVSYLFNSFFWIWMMIISNTYNEIFFVIFMYMILAPPFIMYFYRQFKSIYNK